MKTIVITGADSFIGKHLIDFLLKSEEFMIRALSHGSSNAAIEEYKNLTWVSGDMLISDSLLKLVTPESIVVNLAYLWGWPQKENLQAAANLVEACKKSKIKRLIHCSTAVVVGMSRAMVIDENTDCYPSNDYEKIKFALEKYFLEKAANSFETIILRPTAVFGPKGQNLLKLADSLRTGKRIMNYIKSCLFDKRRMNLVCLDNVVAAVGYFINTKEKLNREIFFISDDEYPENNYRDIEKYLMKGFGYKDYFIRPFPMPLFVLTILLRLSGKSNLNPLCIYDCQKLLKFGFKKSCSFENGLDLFLDWYKKYYGHIEKKNAL